jgi:hypothetical protein
MTPLLDPVTVATPLAKVIVVAVPKLVAMPEAFVTVGWVVPAVAAPENVRVFGPVYEVAVLLYWSRAIVVRLSAAPAAGLVVIADRARVAAVVGLTVKLADVPVTVVDWVAVNVVDWASYNVTVAVPTPEVNVTDADDVGALFVGLGLLAGPLKFTVFEPAYVVAGFP